MKFSDFIVYRAAVLLSFCRFFCFLLFEHGLFTFGVEVAVGFVCSILREDRLDLLFGVLRAEMPVNENDESTEFSTVSTCL